MSRIAIISDVHANLPALQSVLNAIDAEGICHIISLGDVAGYGPFINECCDVLRERNILNLMGNHDNYLAKDMPCPRSETANLAINYQANMITNANKIWLAASPLRHELPGISMVHAGWNDPIDEYMIDIPIDYFVKFSEEIFISGHTHVQGAWQLDDKTYINPGAVGQPRDGDPRAAYLILNDDKTFDLRRVVYDIPAYQAACQRAGLPEKLWRCVENGTRIGGAVSQVNIIQP